MAIPAEAQPPRPAREVELPLRLIAEVVAELSFAEQTHGSLTLPGERSRNSGDCHVGIGDFDLRRIRDDIVPGVHSGGSGDVERAGMMAFGAVAGLLRHREGQPDRADAQSAEPAGMIAARMHPWRATRTALRPQGRMVHRPAAGENGGWLQLQGSLPQ